MSAEHLQLSDDLFNVWFPDLYECNDRYLIPFGGAGSGKSVGVAQKIIINNINCINKKTLMCRKTKQSVENSVFSQIRNVLSDWGISHWYKVNLTKHSFTNIYNGNSILSTGLDDVERLKSIAGVTDIWIEEATECNLADFIQLNLRLRGIHLENPQIILTFNPVSEHNWLKKHFFDKVQPSSKIIKTTYLDNRFLDKAYIDMLNDLVQTSSNFHKIYVDGEWGVDDKSGKFCYAFKESVHVKPTTWNTSEITYLSFDFNVNPITATAIQHYGGVIRCIKSFKLADSNIYSLCQVISARFPGAAFIVTGDATGQNRSALVQDNVNYYTVIQKELGLGDAQIDVPSVNPAMVENKVLVNAILENYRVEIDPEECKPLIYDMTYVEVDTQNKIIKDRVDDTRKADALDSFRYYLNRFHWNFLRYYKK